MSEQAPERTRGRAAGGGSWFTRRSGPFNLPNWEWIGFLAVVALLFLLLRRQSKSQSQQQGTTGAAQCPPGYVPDSQGNCIPASAGAAEVPQFVNQTFTTLSAPEQTTINVPPSPGLPPVVPPSKVPTGRGVARKIIGYQTYTVKKGETLTQLAQRFGIPIDTLADANVYVPGEVPGNKKVGQTLGTGAGLKTGQVLKVPVYA